MSESNDRNFQRLIIHIITRADRNDYGVQKSCYIDVT